MESPGDRHEFMSFVWLRDMVFFYSSRREDLEASSKGEGSVDIILELP